MAVKPLRQHQSVSPTKVSVPTGTYTPGLAMAVRASASVSFIGVDEETYDKHLNSPSLKSKERRNQSKKYKIRQTKEYIDRQEKLARLKADDLSQEVNPSETKFDD